MAFMLFWPVILGAVFESQPCGEYIAQGQTSACSGTW